MYKMLIISGIIVLFFSCCESNNSDIEDLTIVDYKIKSINIDTMFTPPLAFSGSGFYRIKDSTILFFDKIYYTISEFNSKGKMLQRILGRGSGPREIREFVEAQLRPNGSLLFTTSNYMLSLYSADFEFESQVRLDFGTQNKGYNSSDALDPGTYSLDYNMSLFGTSWVATNNDYVFLPVTINHRVNTELSVFHDYKVHVEKARRVARVRLSDGTVEFVFGFHDDVYNEKPTIAHDLILLDIKENNVYTTQAAAEKIVVYDTDGNSIYKFGVAGTNMRTDYVYTPTFEETATRIRDLNKEYGFYYHIFADKKSDLVFRSYSRGGTENGGLQVYQGTELIGDFTVPNRFNVIGRIGDDFYADGLLDEESDQLGIYKFKLIYEE